MGSMVGNLTSGKKKYELYKAEKLRNEFLDLVEKDAKVFEPLSKAYGLPKGTEKEKKIKEEIMEKALKQACSVPLEIMAKALEAMELHEELAVKGTKIAISDVGVGMLFCKSALLGASLNVFINTKLMKGRIYAEAINTEAEAMIAVGIEKALTISSRVIIQSVNQHRRFSSRRGSDRVKTVAASENQTCPRQRSRACSRVCGNGSCVIEFA